MEWSLVFSVVLLTAGFSIRLSHTECVDHKVRLVGGNSTSEGRVEVCVSQSWATVCDEEWDILDAQVICRQLGYPTEGAVSEAFSDAVFGPGMGRIALSNVRCLGSENSLLLCPANMDPSNCNHTRDVEVRCFQSCTTYDLRITAPLSGVLEICIDGTWRKICSFNLRSAAAVACRELGYSPNNAILLSVPRGAGPDNRVSFSCSSGTESRIGLCNPLLQPELCTMQGDAGVICLEICAQGAVRLVSGYSPMEGRVEVCVSGHWGTVCDDLWDDTDAMVVCQQLGFYSPSLGAAALNSTFGWGSGPIHLSNVQCTGTEQSLLSCRHREDGNCFHSEDAGVTCLGQSLSRRCPENAIRLASLEIPSGRPQVCLSGAWVPICSRRWTKREAQIACRQLGYAGEGALLSFFATGPFGSKAQITGNNRCTGDEENFSECNAVFTSCSSAGIIGLQCEIQCLNGELRLVGGRTDLEGRVEVCVDGKWESLSGSGWGINEAAVVCRQLNYNRTGAIPFRTAVFGEGSGPIVANRIVCNGREADLAACNISSVPTVFTHSEDAGVRCLCDESSVRLVNGLSSLVGRVEVCINGSYGTICDNGFDLPDASVICRQLQGRATQVYPSARFGEGFGFIVIDGLLCTGNETSVLDCNYDWQTADCSHSEDSSVMCEGTRCTENGLRLGNRDFSIFEGRVEICIGQTWWSVCDNLWDEEDAQVVCRQLGLSTEGAVPIRNYNYFGQTRLEQYLDSVSCNGTESDLYSCEAHQRPHFCNPSSQAGVRCQATCSEGKVRLTGGNVTFGRVEVCINGSYRTMCADDWENSEATVVCRQLQQSTIGAVKDNFNGLSSHLLPFRYHCSGSESSLAACNSTLSSECTNDIEAGVRCHEGCTSDLVRSVNINPDTPEQFFVEICVDGMWTTACRDNWDLAEARVVCRELGYNAISVEVFDPPAGISPPGPFVGGFMCSGNEVRLADCSYNTLNSCSRQGGVQCSGVPCVEGQLRLMDGTNAMSSSTEQYDGRVEICVDGTWGTVCDDLWDNNDAQVVCNSLGFSRLGATAYSGGQYPSGTGLIKLSNVLCNGSESSLLNCSAIVNHTCTHAEDAGVRCRASCPPDHPAFSDCANGGVCVLASQDQSSNFCQCLPGFTGPRCETDIDNYCLSRECDFGTCVEGYGEATECSCNHGYTGEFCETEIYWCNSGICQNGGACIDHPIRGVICNCVPGFIGDFCETDLCPAGLCMNGGTCQLIDGSCACSSEFTGSRCESTVFCASQSCQNEGTCEGNACICPLGYEGTNCEIDVDNCVNVICENDGTCNDEEGITTSCSCPPKYGGPTCAVEVTDRNAPCREEVDEGWNLKYSRTPSGERVVHRCSNIFPAGMNVASSGNSSRACEIGGIWGSIDVSQCRREDIVQLERMANEIFGQDNIDGRQVDNLVDELATATTPQGVSQFPRDLQAITSIIDMTVDYFQDNLKTPSLSQLGTRIVKVMSNVLDEENIIGWDGIAQGNVGSEQLLRSAEMYGNYFAVALINDNVNKSAAIIESKSIVESNIELQAAIINQDNIEDVVFPAKIDSSNVNEIGSTRSIVPKSFLINRGAESHDVNVINILFKNLEFILPRHSILTSQQPATGVISTQVIPMGNVSSSMGSQNATVRFQFTTRVYGSDKDVTNATCVFFQFERNLAKSTWSTENVITKTAVLVGDNVFNVTCESQHLTSFAILVNINNAPLSDPGLTYITYIGLSISIFCLVLTILFFAVFMRKKIFESVHFFIHLNLSIALLLGYVIFLAGVDTAVGNRIGCAFVAVFLHYFFTAAFCWMLCEGVMIYLMLVVVFSQLSKKWWFFFLLGWGPPVIIVGISVAIIHRQYGTEKYCWISAEDPSMGAVWAFALPMLIIILINTVFLVAALFRLYKLRRDKYTKLAKHATDKNTGMASKELFRQLFVASIVLLPLLGLTWVFGLLSVNDSTRVFAYLFTIFNSFQGFFIFVFHVIRNEHVWDRFCGKKIKEMTTRSTNPTQTKMPGPTSSKSQDFSVVVSTDQGDGIEMDDARNTKKFFEAAEGEDDKKEDVNDDDNFSETIKLIEGGEEVNGNESNGQNENSDKRIENNDEGNGEDANLSESNEKREDSDQEDDTELGDAGITNKLYESMVPENDINLDDKDLSEASEHEEEGEDFSKEIKATEDNEESVKGGSSSTSQDSPGNESAEQGDDIEMDDADSTTELFEMLEHENKHVDADFSDVTKLINDDESHVKTDI